MLHRKTTTLPGLKALGFGVSIANVVFVKSSLFLLDGIFSRNPWPGAARKASHLLEADDATV